MSSFPFSLDLNALRERYLGGNLTPTRLVEEIWSRCSEHGDAAVWIHRLPREALLAHARRVETKGIASQPLYGVPFAIKDNIDLAGVPTTAACPAFAYVPAESAPVVSQLMAAGAIPIGKTNLDQFATGLVGVRAADGGPRNPFHPAVIPGGSSSGSAVAVAEGLVSFSLGTDTAGSGRVPAGLNNLVGLKPTRGALSTRGVVPACRSLDCVSIFALTCADAAAVARVAERFDPQDAWARPRPASVTGRWTKPLRVGVPAASAREFFGDTSAEQLFEAALAQLEPLGAQRVEIDFTPFREAAALLYQGPWVAERWAVLRAFHAQHADAFFPVTRRIVEAAATLTAADAFDGFHRLAELARRAEAEWKKMDVLLVPTAPRPYTRAEVEAEPVLLNSRLGTYTNFVNLLDLAALAVPAGLRPDGIPWGVTFIAPAWREPDLLALGARWHERIGGRLGATDAAAGSAPKLATPAATGTVRLAVVGAHLTGLPLNHQLTDCGARLVGPAQTAPDYRFYCLPDTIPPKPGLVRAGPGAGGSIAVEIWELMPAAFGTFVAGVPPPLCIGTVMLAGGETVKGFLCEAHAVERARDITAFGGWRAFLAKESK